MGLPAQESAESLTRSAWKRNFRAYLVTAISIFIIDQLVKVWARTEGEVEGRVFGMIWPGVIELKLVYNTGIAFGLLEGAGVFMAPIAIFIVALVTYMAWVRKEEGRSFFIIYGLLVAGAIGNLYDRVFHGKVTDMFWLRFIDFPVFNIADMAITAFAVLVVFSIINEIIHEKRNPQPHGQEIGEIQGPEEQVEPEGPAEKDRPETN